MTDQGELALILESDKEGKPIVVGYKTPGNKKESFAKEEVISTYLSASLETNSYTDQELHTLEVHLSEVVGKQKSDKLDVLHLATKSMQNESKVKTREVGKSKDFSRKENSIPQKEDVLNYLVEQNKFEDGNMVGSDISRERQLADVKWRLSINQLIRRLNRFLDQLQKSSE